MTNAAMARAKFEELLAQEAEMQKFVVDADAFTRRTIADVSLEALFTDGPFQGKSWIDVYKEMQETRQKLSRIRYPLKEAEFEAICLESLESHGKCFVSVSGTDCDCSSYSYAHTFDSLEEARSYKESAYDSADGPIGVCALTKEEYESHESYSHDLALAAHEDGHPYSVSEADWKERR